MKNLGLLESAMWWILIRDSSARMKEKLSGLIKKFSRDLKFPIIWRANFTSLSYQDGTNTMRTKKQIKNDLRAFLMNFKKRTEKIYGKTKYIGQALAPAITMTPSICKNNLNPKNRSFPSNCLKTIKIDFPIKIFRNAISSLWINYLRKLN